MHSTSYLTSKLNTNTLSTELYDHFRVGLDGNNHIHYERSNILEPRCRSIITRKTKTNFSCNLVLASGASWHLPGLGTGRPCLGIRLLRHHDRKANVTTNGILVTRLTGVDPTGVGRVSLVRFKGVEVTCRARSVGVPLVVQILLRVLIEKLAVVLAIFEVEFGERTWRRGRDEG